MSPIDAALYPLSTAEGWHGLAYGLVFYKTITMLIRKVILERFGVEE